MRFEKTIIPNIFKMNKKNTRRLKILSNKKNFEKKKIRSVKHGKFYESSSKKNNNTHLMNDIKKTKVRFQLKDIEPP